MENNRYYKYKNILKNKIFEQCVTGKHLIRVDIFDIISWGITQFDDKKDLFNSIKQLVQQNKNKNNNMDEGSFQHTDYI